MRRSRIVAAVATGLLVLLGADDEARSDLLAAQTLRPDSKLVAEKLAELDGRSATAPATGSRTGHSPGR